MKIKFRYALLLKNISVLLFIMRSFIFFFCTAVFSFSSGNVISQNAKVTVDADKIVTVEEVFDLIDKQTEYSFVYKPALFTNLPAVQLRKGIIPINKLIKKSLSSDNFNITINKNKTIYIKEKVLKEEPQYQKSVSGKITDDKGEPLLGANVIEKGTTNGASADIDGNYSITVSDEEAILVFSYTGYTQQEIKVENQEKIDVRLIQSASILDEVIVTGYRKSLEAAIDIKRKNINGVDAIVAEDIAKFPQSNLAEALQRVSGVQIRRDNAGGVGSSISIRGLPSEYTQVTINGDAVPNSTGSRSYDFGTLPAEIFKQVEVIKTPTASTTEGGIGGSVNLVTKKPFELKKRVLVATQEGIYNTQQQVGKRVTPKWSLSYGNKWNDKFGIIASVSFNQFFNTSESYDVVRYNEKSFDLDRNGINEFENIRVPLPRYVSQGQEVKRLSLNLAMQYQVNKNFDLVVQGLFVNNDQVETRYAPVWILGNGNNPSNITAEGSLLRTITYENVSLLLENQQQSNVTKNYRWSIKGKYNLPKDWKVGAKFIHAFNKRDSERFRYYADNVNTVTYSVQNDLEFFNIQTPTNLSDADEFIVSQARRYLWDYSDEIFTGKLDFRKKISNKFKLGFGASFRDRTKTQQYFFRRNTEINDPFRPVAVLLTNFLDNVDRATGHNQFLVHDFDKSFKLYGSQLDLEDFEVINTAYDINEKVSAGYIQGNYSAGKLKANAGLRIVHTGITSRGYQLDNATQIYQVREIPSDYTDFLPSVNLKWEFKRNLIARAGYARVITRPRLQDLSAFRSIDEVNKRISSSNPELDPFRANQYDISLEWYPGSETLISGSYFVKDIESFISRQTTNIIFNGEEYELRQPVNGNNAVIKGFEINYQQPFTFLPGFLSGFGIVTNYTFSESNFKETLEDGSLTTYSLPNNSKHSFNITPYFEKYDFSLRVATNFRSSFLREIPNPEDGLKYRDDVSITDISSSYDFNDNIGITLNILNAFNAQRYEFIDDRRFQDNASFFGTTFQLGVRVKF